MTYVFLGAYSEVLGAGIKLTRFGQRVELPAPVAEQAKEHGGLPCIPAEEFDTVGFTDEELRKFGPPREELAGSSESTWTKEYAEFRAKKRQALEILHTIRGGE